VGDVPTAAAGGVDGAKPAHAAVRAARCGAQGRKPWDEVLIFKALVVQALYNLSDEQMEYQLRDRLSFMRFLGLGLEDPVPDATTLWLYREALARAGAVEALFAAFDGHLRGQGFLAMGGQIVDATIVAAPRQRNSRNENADIKDGRKPEEWDAHPAKKRQKDTDARLTKKHGRSHYGYKNHLSMDRRYKLVRRYTVTHAARHDSVELDAVLDRANTCSKVWARLAKVPAGEAGWNGKTRATAPIARPRSKPVLPSRATRAASIGVLHATTRSRRARSRATRPARACVPGWSTCSAIKRPACAASWCAPSGWCARR